jgi:hypothetical protein
MSALALLPMWATAEVVVVVGDQSPARSLTRREVVDLFMGRSRRFADGTPARAIDFPSGDPLRQQFFAALTGKSEAQIDAYWAQLVFAGRMSPLPRVVTTSELADRLRQEPQWVSFMRIEDLGRGLRVVCSLATEP